MEVRGEEREAARLGGKVLCDGPGKACRAAGLSGLRATQASLISEPSYATHQSRHRWTSHALVRQ